MSLLPKPTFFIILLLIQTIITPTSAIAFNPDLDYSTIKYYRPFNISWYNNKGNVYIYASDHGTVKENVPGAQQYYLWTPQPRIPESGKITYDPNKRYRLQMFDEENYSVWSPEFRILYVTEVLTLVAEGIGSTTSELSLETSTGTAKEEATAIATTSLVKGDLPNTSGPVQTQTQTTTSTSTIPQTSYPSSTGSAIPPTVPSPPPVPTKTIAGITASIASLLLVVSAILVFIHLRRRRHRISEMNWRLGLDGGQSQQGQVNCCDGNQTENRNGGRKRGGLGVEVGLELDSLSVGVAGVNGWGDEKQAQKQKQKYEANYDYGARYCCGGGGVELSTETITEAEKGKDVGRDLLCREHNNNNKDEKEEEKEKEQEKGGILELPAEINNTPTPILIPVQSPVAQELANTPSTSAIAMMSPTAAQKIEHSMLISPRQEQETAAVQQQQEHIQEHRTANDWVVGGDEIQTRVCVEELVNAGGTGNALETLPPPGHAPVIGTVGMTGGESEDSVSVGLHVGAGAGDGDRHHVRAIDAGSPVQVLPAILSIGYDIAAGDGEERNKSVEVAGLSH